MQAPLIFQITGMLVVTELVKTSKSDIVETHPKLQTEFDVNDTEVIACFIHLWFAILAPAGFQLCYHH